MNVQNSTTYGETFPNGTAGSSLHVRPLLASLLRPAEIMRSNGSCRCSRQSRRDTILPLQERRSPKAKASIMGIWTLACAIPKGTGDLTIPRRRSRLSRSVEASLSIPRRRQHPKADFGKALSAPARDTFSAHVGRQFRRPKVSGEIR